MIWSKQSISLTLSSVYQSIIAWYSPDLFQLGLHSFPWAHCNGLSTFWIYLFDLHHFGLPSNCCVISQGIDRIKDVLSSRPDHLSIPAFLGIHVSNDLCHSRIRRRPWPYSRFSLYASCIDFRFDPQRILHFTNQGRVLMVGRIAWNSICNDHVLDMQHPNICGEDILDELRSFWPWSW